MASLDQDDEPVGFVDARSLVAKVARQHPEADYGKLLAIVLSYTAGLTKDNRRALRQLCREATAHRAMN